ncbi:hypothetical protein [Actinobacillus vicugnae]|nr:hypothetical protein [Actinobacillus vicugnae]
MKPKFNENKPRFQTVDERRDSKFQTKSDRFVICTPKPGHLI